MSTTRGHDAATGQVAEAIGRLMAFWGFKRMHGRIWAVLYLSPRELSAMELCEQLEISAGAASMALAELERWGVVHRYSHVGERREYFRPETAIWKMISRVWREREKQEVERLVQVLDEALAALDAERHASAPSRAEGRFRRERLVKLRRLASLGRGLIALALAGGFRDLVELHDTDLG